MRERGMRYREIGEELGMSMSSVNHDLERGRQRERQQRAVTPSAMSTESRDAVNLQDSR
jgi:DNA-directed RNA polymerase specialized sigma24 family protein